MAGAMQFAPSFAADEQRYDMVKKLARKEFKNDKKLIGLMVDNDGIDLRPVDIHSGIPILRKV